MKLTPVKSIPQGRGSGQTALFDRVFPTPVQRTIAQNPGQPFRVGGILFTAKQVSALAAKARKEGYALVSRQIHEPEQNDWELYGNAEPKNQADRRVVFITFTPALLNKKKGKQNE